jgi:hypothetical protein
MIFKSTRNALRHFFPTGGQVAIRATFLVTPMVATCLLLPSCNLIGAALGLGVAKLHFGCLPQGTLIDTADGPVKIETLKSGDLICGFGGQPVQITQIHQYREDPATSRYLTVSFANGATIRASPRHRIDHIPASQLVVGGACGPHTVTGIEPLHGISRSFDLLTEDAGYRIGGIPVNSMIEEMLAR